VQEEADAETGRLLLEHRRKQEEVVVVDPDEVAGLGDLQYGVGEQTVDPFVGGPGVVTVIHEIGEVVEQGPEGVIAEALVEGLGVLGGEEDGKCRVLLAAAAGRLVMEFGADRAAGPADPDVVRWRGTAWGIQVAAEAGGQAAGALGEVQLPIVLADGNREAVGDDDEFHGA
jgi:hypothetical protein